MNPAQKRITIWTLGPVVAGAVAVASWWGGHETAISAAGYHEGELSVRVEKLEDYQRRTEALAPLLYETAGATRANTQSVRDLVEQIGVTNQKLDRLIEAVRLPRQER